jgi:hypothetical protein
MGIVTNGRLQCSGVWAVILDPGQLMIQQVEVTLEANKRGKTMTTKIKDPRSVSDNVCFETLYSRGAVRQSLDGRGDNISWSDHTSFTPRSQGQMGKGVRDYESMRIAPVLSYNCEEYSSLTRRRVIKSTT